MAKAGPRQGSVPERVGEALGAEFKDAQMVKKHRSIAEAASRVFMAHGYLPTSVDEIALEAGVSKQTVYKHFGSKENLFLAVTNAATDAVTSELGAQLEATTAGSADAAAELTAFARILARRVLRPEMMALRRLVMAETVRFPELGRNWYAHGPGRVVEQLKARFRELAKQGLLSIDDPASAAENFLWLVLASPQNKILFGAATAFTDAEIDKMATSSVKVFLAAYQRHPTAVRRSSVR